LEQIFADGAHPCELQVGLDAAPMVFYFAATATLQIRWFAEPFEAYLAAPHLFGVFLQFTDVQIHNFLWRGPVS